MPVGKIPTMNGEIVEIGEGETSIPMDSLINKGVTNSTSKWGIVRNRIGSIQLLVFKWSRKMEVENIKGLPNVMCQPSIEPDMRGFLERDMHSTTGPRRSIFYMPDKIKLVPIGPYHPPALREEALITVSKKWICAKYLIEYFGLNLLSCLTQIEAEEARIRSCYAQHLDSVYTGEAFKELFFLDSCFIWFFIYIVAYGSYDYLSRKKILEANSVELILLQNIMDQHVLPDLTSNENQIKIELLMLGNQIPWFLIKIITDCLANIGMNPLESALICFENIYPRIHNHRDYFLFIKTNFLLPDERFQHLLHIYHWSLVSIDSDHWRNQISRSSRVYSPPSRFYMKACIVLYHIKRQIKIRLMTTHSDDKKDEESIELETSFCVPNAIELHESSTSFRRFWGPLDIIFRPGMIWPSAKMQISALHIFDYSSTLFKHLINFEQKYQRCGFHITGYMTCIVRLLQTKEDVNLLRKNNILPNTMKNDEEILDFVQEMRMETRGARIPRDLKALYRRVTKHHGGKLNRAYGGFKHHYCPNPWITLSVFGGVSLFILTFLQTVYTILGYKQS